MISEDLYSDLAVICDFLGELSHASPSEMKLLQLKHMAQTALADCQPDAAERFILAAGHVARLIMLEQGLCDETAMERSAEFSSSLKWSPLQG